MGEYKVRSRRNTPSSLSYSYLLDEFLGISTIIRTTSGECDPGSRVCNRLCMCCAPAQPTALCKCRWTCGLESSHRRCVGWRTGGTAAVICWSCELFRKG